MTAICMGREGFPGGSWRIRIVMLRAGDHEPGENGRFVELSLTGARRPLSSRAPRS